MNLSDVARSAAIAAAVVAAPAALGAGAAPSAAAAPCPDVEVVFARGTGEPPGLGDVGNAFANSLRAQIAPRTVGTYGVNYPANRNFLAAGGGAVDTNNRVAHMAAACPGTQIVLGGFSQGAAVMDIVAGVPVAGIRLGQAMPPPLAERVAAVAVFGNPSNLLVGPLTALSPMFGFKAIDLCNGADPICSDGRDVSAHSLYVESGMASQAASFAAARV